MEEETSASEQIDADLCPICLDVFFTTEELLEHVLETYHVFSNETCSKMVQKSSGDTVCPLCHDSASSQPGLLLKHMFATHSVSTEEKCSKCQNEFEQKTTIKTEIVENVSLKTEVKDEKVESFVWESNVAVKNEKANEAEEVKRDCEDKGR